MAVLRPTWYENAILGEEWSFGDPADVINTHASNYVQTLLARYPERRQVIIDF
jgi:hypothetical protein